MQHTPDVCQLTSRVCILQKSETGVTLVIDIYTEVSFGIKWILYHFFLIPQLYTMFMHQGAFSLCSMNRL